MRHYAIRIIAPRRFRLNLAAAFVGLGLCCGGANAQLSQQHIQAPPPANAAGPETRPYDSQLFRLAEILGAIHYLRDLCGAAEGQLWRDQMRNIVASEGTSPLRRAKLVESFNRGYRGYSRTYRTCTRPAIVAIDRFMEQGASLSEAMVAADR
jgi:uncharacterized protein (TIGR02301 family)